MRNWYLLNYVLYKWYSKRDSTPIIYTTILAPTLLYINILTVASTVSYITGIKLAIPKIIYQITGLLLALVNTIILHRNKNYVRIFSEFDSNPQIFLRTSRIVRYYIICTVLTLLSILILFDIKHDGHL